MVLIFHGQPLLPKYRQRIENIIPAIICIVEDHIVGIQQKALSARRVANNALCKEKCNSGPAIHNFTDYQIPEVLEKMLAPGLQTVPTHTRPTQEVGGTVLKDVCQASISYFQATMGYRPAGLEHVKGLDATLQFLSSRTPCGSPKSEFYFSLRDKYICGYKPFISKLATPTAVPDPMQVVQECLPDNIIITPTDKNLGVALVPITWYELQYASQCKKGNYEKADMDEGQCIRYLEGKIKVFREGLTADQTQILKAVWPLAYNRQPTKIGVMKLVPKVHKLDKIDLDSWKILTSRPIRGAENCPLNPASKVLFRQIKVSLSLNIYHASF